MKTLLFLLMAASAFSPHAQVNLTLSGKSIQISTYGDVVTDGHCFGNVSALPSGPGLRIFENAFFTNGNLFFTGDINLLSESFPGMLLVPDYTSVTNDGDFNIAGTCQNSAGCSNTKWEPSIWNDDEYTLDNNNCYNYGNDKITNTFAQPGYASGHLYSYFTVNEIKNAAIYDGLIWVGDDFPENTYDCGTGHLIFGAVWEGADFHWWRLDQKDGLWSHKPGPGLATNRDWDDDPEGWTNDLITNPLTANRGSYTLPVGFFCTCGSLANVE